MTFFYHYLLTYSLFPEHIKKGNPSGVRVQDRMISCFMQLFIHTLKREKYIFIGKILYNLIAVAFILQRV